MANSSTMSFTATVESAALLSDQDLLDATVRVAGNERHRTGAALALGASFLRTGEPFAAQKVQQRHLRPVRRRADGSAVQHEIDGSGRGGLHASYCICRSEFVRRASVSD